MNDVLTRGTFFMRVGGRATCPPVYACLRLENSGNSVWGSHSKTQAITLGGVDREGRDASNPLTMAFLRAGRRVRMPDPCLYLRWHRGLDRSIKEEALSMLASSCSMPILLGDEETVKGFTRVGIPLEDARDYCVVGCNELGIPVVSGLYLCRMTGVAFTQTRKLILAK